MKFSIAIEKESKIKWRFYLLFFLLMLFNYSIYKIKFNHNHFLFLVTTICWILVMIFSILINLYKKVEITGEIEFGDNLILIHNIDNQVINTININEVEEIKLIYNAYKGDIPESPGFYILDYIPSKGGSNRISIKMDNTSIGFNIYLKDTNDAYYFKKLYRDLKEKNVNVKYVY